MEDRARATVLRTQEVHLNICDGAGFRLRVGGGVAPYRGGDAFPL